MAEIVLDGVTKRFPDGTEAVKRASFTIRDGELFLLVGPSGCGKSTLLNMIVGLEDITEGELRVDGKLMNHVDPKDRNMAMVFQSYALYPHMSVRENIAFPLKLRRMSAEEIARRVEQAADTLQLSALLDRKPAQLSGGQRQRVAMGRAMVREPVAFLMDEPLSNLDARLRIQMRTEIGRIQSRLRATTIYVTHDQTEAMTLGDRIAVMHAGAILQLGTPRQLYTEPSNLFVASFIGTPAMNLLPAEIRGARLRLPIGEVDLADEPTVRRAGPVIAGIRPEHFADPALTPSSFPGLTFSAVVDVVEWLGADLYVQFDLSTSVSQEPHGAALDFYSVEALRGERSRIVARLDPRSHAAKGEKIEIHLDASRIHLFDPQSGERLAARTSPLPT